MVDWGILAFFVVQLAMTFAVYHALGGVKAEKSVLLSESEKLRLCKQEFTAVAARMDTIEKAPAERMKRVEALADEIADKGRDIEKVRKAVEGCEFKIHSLNGRIAANAKAEKRARLKGDDDEELDPAPQGEGGEYAQAPYPPGSIPHAEQPKASAIPPGFGVVRRAV